MKLREHDKQALQIIATNKSVGGRYYDFEAFLEQYGRWSRAGVIPCRVSFSATALQEAFCFLDTENILLFVDKVIADLKSVDFNKVNFAAFELYFLISDAAEQERADKEKLLRKQLKYKKGRFLSAYTKARESFQELIRVNLLKLLNE